jgi:cytochrome c
MKRSHLMWDEKTLDRFLANPPKFVPGTAMTYAGVPDAQERADLIAYLREAGQSAACRAIK